MHSNLSFIYRKISLAHFDSYQVAGLLQGADNFLARPERKQANVSVRMA